MQHSRFLLIQNIVLVASKYFLRLNFVLERFTETGIW